MTTLKKLALGICLVGSLVAFAPSAARAETKKTTKKVHYIKVRSYLPKWLVPDMVKACIHDRVPIKWVETKALAEIIHAESSFNPHAQNPSSTAYGLFQFLDSTWATVGGRKTSNVYLQCVYGLKYIKERYGNPDAAWAFHLAHGWY